MGIAAVPNYLGQDFTGAPPGHRFGLYFSCWQQQDWAMEPDPRRTDDRDKGKLAALKKVTALDEYSGLQLKAIRQRQKAVADLSGDAVWRLSAQSTSPFMTGTGMEHPLENGFAFLNPYGLPYLPGSGVKGVLRRAAEELALGFYGDTGGWNMLSLWFLFGFEPNSVYFTAPSAKTATALREEAQHWHNAYRNPETQDAVPRDLLEAFIEIALDKQSKQPYRANPFSLLNDFITDQKLRDAIRNRGALTFWDVLPELYDNKLMVEIMTPHYSDYYQGKTTPHDSGQPNPIVFLALPPNSRFEFFVQCDKAVLPKSLRNNWQSLLEAVFQHAFDWLGFGAKTAVGYGQFPCDAIERANAEREEEKRQIALAEKAEAAARSEAALSNGQRAIRDLNRWFEDDKNAKRKEPGGQLTNRLNELFGEALSWNGEEREDLAKLAEAIFGYLDWGSGKKKQERKAKIQQLRVGSL